MRIIAPPILLFFQLCLIGSIGHAFDYTKCTDATRGSNLFGFSTTTTSFVSSFGPCSALAMKSKKNEILQYVTANSSSLQKDLARKSGEHLTALQHLAQLDENQKAKLTGSAEAQQMLISENYEQFYQLLLTL